MDIKMIGKHVGYDIGHCETTGTITRMNNGQPEVVRANVDDRNTVVLSQLRLTNEQMDMLKGNLQPGRELLDNLGQITIGEIYNYDETGETFSYFKVSPDHFDDVCAKSAAGKAAGITHGQIMACFIYAVMQSTLEYNGLVEEDREQMTLYIGCPTTEKWTDAEPSERYADLARRATGVKNVLIIPESRAALYSSLEKRSFTALSAEEGIIVFDFGSSTADCTFMRLGVGKMEYSWDLGAHSIEENMAKMVQEKLFEKFGEFELTSESLDNLINECRKFKEIYFKRGPCEMTANVREIDGKKQMYNLSIDADFMRIAIEERRIQVKDHDNQVQFGTWYDLCREFLHTAQAKMKEQAYEASAIVLTGGASRMPFLEKLCKDVYGSNVKIYKEDNPSHTVSTGLGWLPVVEDNFDESVKAVAETVKADDSCGLAPLKQSIKDAVYDIVSEQIPLAAQEWANAADEVVTYKDLGECFKRRMERPEEQKKLHKAIEACVNKWKGTLGEKMCEAVNGQAAKLLSAHAAKNMMLRPDLWKSLEAKSLVVDLDVSKIVNSLDLNSTPRQCARWSIIVAAIAIGAAFGFIGVAIGAWIGDLIASLLDDKDLDKSCPKNKRQRILRQIPNVLKSKEVRKEVLKAIDENFRSFEAEYDGMLEQIAADALSIVTLRTFSLQKDAD